jgi:hypothetical protein
VAEVTRADAPSRACLPFSPAPTVPSGAQTPARWASLETAAQERRSLHSEDAVPTFFPYPDESDERGGTMGIFRAAIGIGILRRIFGGRRRRRGGLLRRLFGRPARARAW